MDRLACTALGGCGVQLTKTIPRRPHPPSVCSDERSVREPEAVAGCASSEDHLGELTCRRDVSTRVERIVLSEHMEGGCAVRGRRGIVVSYLITL
eukprot:1245182-Prymnesium_polylepis.1